MKKQHFRWLGYVLLAGLPGLPAAAEEPLTPEYRSYNRAVEMHTAPLEEGYLLKNPDQEPKPSVSKNLPTRSDFKWLDQGASFTPIMPYNIITVPPEKKDKNWLLPSKNEPDGDKKEAKGSGWGWLADDLKHMQQERELSQKKQEDKALRDPSAEEDELFPQPKKPESMQERKEKPQGRETTQPFEPVKTSELFAPTLDDSPDSLLAGRISKDTPEAGASPRGKPASGGPNVSRPTANESRRIQSGMDEAWGLERTRNSIAQGQEIGLSQTATILKDMTAPAQKPLSVGLSSPTLPGSTLSSGFSTANPLKTPAAGSLFSSSGNAPLKDQGLFKPVAGDVGGSSLLSTHKPTQAPLSSPTPSISGQQGNFNSLQQPPKDFWKMPGTYK